MSIFLVLIPAIQNLTIVLKLNTFVTDTAAVYKTKQYTTRSQKSLTKITESTEVSKYYN